MKVKIKEKAKALLEKVKISKKIQILLILFALCVILLVYLTYNSSKVQKGETNIIVESGSTEEYISNLETKLEKTISNIDGVNGVSVVITVSSGFVYEYAYEETSKESLSSTSSTSSLVLIDNEPVVVSMTYPKISGVLVVVDGGGNLKVKLDILSSIQTLIDVSNENITIVNGKF